MDTATRTLCGYIRATAVGDALMVACVEHGRWHFHGLGHDRPETGTTVHLGAPLGEPGHDGYDAVIQPQRWDYRWADLDSNITDAYPALP